MKRIFTSLIAIAAMLAGTTAWGQLCVAGHRVTTTGTETQTITGSGISGKVTYNPTYKYLVLENATITANGSDESRFGILNLTVEDLKIYFVGTCRITANSSSAAEGAGIYSKQKTQIGSYASTLHTATVTVSNTGAGPAIVSLDRADIKFYGINLTATAKNGHAICAQKAAGLIVYCSNLTASAENSNYRAITGFTNGLGTTYTGCPLEVFDNSLHKFDIATGSVVQNGTPVQKTTLVPSIMIGDLALGGSNEITTTTTGATSVSGSVTFNTVDPIPWLELDGFSMTDKSIVCRLPNLEIRVKGTNIITTNEENAAAIQIYANTTFKTTIGKGYSLFAGMAWSSVLNNIDDALVVGDHFHNNRNEVHLKTEIRKVFSQVLKMSGGVEDYLRHSTKRYEESRYTLDYHLPSAHLDAQLRVVPKVFLNLSTRVEQETSGHHWFLLPRTTLSYVPNNHFQLSAMAGRYSQIANDDYMAMSGKQLSQSTADHLILSMQHTTDKTLLRIEPYHKKYHRLPLLSHGTYTTDGYGTSKGLDVFFECHSLVKNLTTTLSYSYNDSRRYYLDYASMQTPDYASRHNLRITAKYAIGKTIIGLADSYASGRKYAVGTTPHYNSLDANITWLVSPKVIVYSSLSNILGRTNIFRYDNAGKPVMANRDRFFYIGIFVSLKSNKAYDISNF